MCGVCGCSCVGVQVFMYDRVNMCARGSVCVKGGFMVQIFILEKKNTKRNTTETLQYACFGKTCVTDDHILMSINIFCSSK